MLLMWFSSILMFCTKEAYLDIRSHCAVHCDNLQSFSWKLSTFKAAAKWVLWNDSHPSPFTYLAFKSCLENFYSRMLARLYLLVWNRRLWSHAECLSTHQREENSMWEITNFAKLVLFNVAPYKELYVHTWHDWVSLGATDYKKPI